MQSLRFLFLSLILLIIPDPNLLAIIRHVPDDYSTIQTAIAASINGDTVLVAPGTYTGSGNQNINFLGKAILVTSEVGPDSTIIEGWEATGFQFQNNESLSSIVDGFTIYDFSHGFWIVGSSPLIKNCKIVECGAWSSVGGGMYLVLSNAIIENCTFSFCWGISGSGTAIYSTSSNPLILNSLFYYNWDDFGWGTIDCDDATIANCTFYINFPSPIIGHPDVLNCIFWLHGDPVDPAANVNYCDIEGDWPGEGNFYEDPLFLDEENFDFRLSVDSPCIDSGDPDSPNVPWGGFRRDMGALEHDQGFYFDGQSIILKPVPIEIPLLLNE